MSDTTLTLYIAGGTANSTRAQQNLAHVLKKIEKPHPKLEVIDLLRDPSCAASLGILVTPTLTFQGDTHREMIIGTLDDTDDLLQQINSWLQR